MGGYRRFVASRFHSVGLIVRGFDSPRLHHVFSMCINILEAKGRFLLEVYWKTAVQP